MLEKGSVRRGARGWFEFGGWLAAVDEGLLVDDDVVERTGEGFISSSISFVEWYSNCSKYKWALYRIGTRSLMISAHSAALWPGSTRSSDTSTALL